MPPEIPQPKPISFFTIIVVTIISLVVGFSATFLILFYVSPALESINVSDMATELINTAHMYVSSIHINAFGTQKASAVQIDEPLTEPKITSLTPSDSLIEGDIINIVFNENMATSSSPLSFDIPGNGTWTDQSTYQFTVGKVDDTKTYAIKLLAGAESEEGATTTSEHTYYVKTATPVVPTFVTTTDEHPIDGPIELSFDQSVNQKSAEDAFHISPSTKGSFSWQGNDLIFTPTKLAYETAYTVTLDAGIQAVHGFPSTASSTLSFTSSAQITKLNVPYFSQQYKNSCEAASTRMALAYYGIKTDDLSIVQKFGYDPKQKDTINNIWDDPNKMFVGDIDDADGYGVYGAPVLKAVEEFGRTGEYKTIFTPAYIAQQIKAGHPVIIWGDTSVTSAPYTWSTPQGNTVTAFKGEHARLVVGVKGSIANPLGFYVHDPINGQAYEYWSTSQLFGNLYAVPGVTNQAVVVE